MVDDDFRKRYETDPVIARVVDMMTGMMDRADLTSHDLARCAVLAAEIHARRCMGPITIVLRCEPTASGPREYIVTEADLERIVDRVNAGPLGD
jgi:hypothetical protein